MNTIVLVILIILLIGAFGGAPNWGLHNYGWGPSGLLGVVLVVLLVLMLVGRI